MSDGMATAVIAGCVALTVAYLTQFVSESYKRHREGSAIAAAIAGELGSYQPAWPMLADMLRSWLDLVQRGNRAAIAFRPFERPKDMVIDEVIDKLGLLGAAQVEAVVSVYSNIRAFRVGLELIMKEHDTMTDAELIGRCHAMQGALDRAAQIGEPLVKRLRARADQAFAKPLGRVYFGGAIAVLCALLVWFGAALAHAENQRYALSLGMCQSDPLKILGREECLKAVETRSGWWWHVGYALRLN
ncbi:hypothetical protein [Variovorax sp. GT1P44]|uniref:hypothetical protein n=1 Tax=Variovorax sp. GT1P44 TaxID=3443742 RepID=UPI003F445640